MAKTVKLREATPIEVVAIGGAFKDKADKAAKSTLKPGSTHQMKFRAEITGTIAKAAGIAGEMVSPKVELFTADTFCGLLRALGIGPKRLREAIDLAGVGAEDDPANAELLATFDQAARDIADTMDKVPAGASPRVTSVLSVKIIDA